MKKWIDGELKDMSKHLGKAMTDNFELMETLMRDPAEFGRKIEQEPWRLATMLMPMHAIPDVARASWAQDKITGFFEADSPDLKLPAGWASDL